MKICVIPGDGIGPEVTGAALRVLALLAPPLGGLEVEEAAAGWGCFQQLGNALPEATLAAARGADAILFGAVASPSQPVLGYRSPIVALRRELDLYANIRPVRSANHKLNHQPPGARGAAGVVDLVVVRENTEDLYVGRERLEDGGDTAIAERVITRRASERIVERAFKLAVSRSKAAGKEQRVTVVHKANVLRVTDGLFREVALEVARRYPQVPVEELLVDTAAMHVARNPEHFDVIVTTNMFGDILSDVACIHGGGLGLASSANLGDCQGLFEPVHGAAPDIAGTGSANPLAAIGCLAMLLDWLGNTDGSRQQGEPGVALEMLRAAARVQKAVEATLQQGPYTADLGGDATTDQVTEAVLARLFT